VLDESEKILAELDEEATPDNLDGYNLETLAKLLLQGREMVRVMRDITGRIEQATVRAMPHRKAVIEGVGHLEKSAETTRRAWDSPLLAGAVLQSAVNTWKEETGEVVSSDVANMVLDAFMKAARPEWRVTALRDMGINADNYCEVSYGEQKVRVTPI
jgi:hypothetical protein